LVWLLLDYYSGREGLGFRVQGSGFRKEAVVGAGRGLIAAGPNRPNGRIAKTITPALVDFLNP
jgi:hypothetical protein